MRKGIRVVHTVIESDNSELRLIDTKAYDTKGRLSSATYYDEYGCKEKETTYEYHSYIPEYKGKICRGIKEAVTTDEQGNFVSSASFNIWGRLTESREDDRTFYYEYEDDKNGNPTMRMDFECGEDPECKNIVGRVIYAYNDVGNIVEEKYEERFWPNDDWVELVKSHPDNDYDENEPEYRIASLTTYKYDEKNRLSSKSYGNVSISYNKEDDGYLKIRTVEYAEGEYGIFWERYNGNGDIIKSWDADYEADEPETPNIIYVSDKVGNWIKRIYVDSDKTERRIIVYAER